MPSGGAIGSVSWASQSASSGLSPVYPGTTSPIHPGGRRSAAVWLDSSSRLFVFGGFTAKGPANDLWVFDSGIWTTTDGSLTTSVGRPSPRYGASVWSDPRHSSTAVYLFGGIGADGVLNDLWRYDMGTKTWTWTWINAATSTGPAGRYGAVAWELSGSLLLFGGSQTSGEYFSDLWTLTAP